ncbi:MAG: hypothetical protein IKL07_02320 [Clostridium sp.]|nr:hypothetical protein [Clostridium sp.]
MKKMILFVILSAIVLVGCQTAKKGENNNGFSDEVAPYTESEEETLTFPVKEQLELSSSICNVVLKQETCSEISVRLTKKVGDKQEEKLQNELKKISCRMEEQKLELGYLDGVQPETSSNYVKAEVTIPDKVRILTVENYIGDVEVTGEYDKFCMNITTGNVKLNVNKLDNEDIYLLNGDVGGVSIKLPKGSNINLCGEQADNVVLASGIMNDASGAVMEINNQTAKITISN